MRLGWRAIDHPDVSMGMMEGGEGRDDPGVIRENDPTAGIVPRALSQLFDDLRMVQVKS